MNLIVIFIAISLVQAIDPKQENKDEEIRNILLKYINTIPDPEPRYVMNTGISKLISKYYDGKIQTFPLFRLTLKIDRNPVKIPWSLGQTNQNNSQNSTYVKVKKLVK